VQGRPDAGASSAAGDRFRAGVAPREQDAGFGYFVAALVQRLRNGERFGVWESDSINMVATPTLASDAADLMWRILERDLDGIFHCCGGESVDRRTLAMRAAQVFELDPTLLDLGAAPPPEAFPLASASPTGSARAAARSAPAAAGSAPAAIPYDTSLDATHTAALLDVELPDVTEMLRRMCRELTPV
jgi:dTDP-4-dehydrorhamnose reductase